METDLEEKLGAILKDPDMMGKIQAMAQSLSQNSQEDSSAQFDPGMLPKLIGLAGQSGVDSNQQTLLAALAPYLSRAKVNKLEKAMRAARLAQLASGFLGNGGLQRLMGGNTHV